MPVWSRKVESRVLRCLPRSANFHLLAKILEEILQLFVRVGVSITEKEKREA
jgi:hypothetical protein